MFLRHRYFLETERRLAYFRLHPALFVLGFLIQSLRHQNHLINPPKE
jgi:hypothetical protein